MKQSDPTPRLDRFDSYAEACANYRLQVPERFNIAQEIGSRHSDAVTRIALLDVKFTGVNTYTFGGLDYLSDKFAVVLSEHGIKQGDRVAVALTQSADAAVAELGVLKAGAVALVVAASYSAMASVLETSRCRALVTDEHSYRRMEGSLNSTSPVVFVAGHRLAPGRFKDFWREINTASSDFDAVKTESNSAALIFPNHFAVHDPSALGIVHTHASAVAALPAFEMANEFLFADETVFWTPLDWSLPSVLLGVLLPAWWYGCAVVSMEKALPAGWMNALDDCSVTHAFISDMHLRFLLDAEPLVSRELVPSLRRIICDAPPEFELRRRCEALAEDLSILRSWPETPGVIASCARWFPTPEGWSGKAAPGYSIEVFDEKGRVCRPGGLGRIAVGVPPQLTPSVLTSDGEIQRKVANRVDVGSFGIREEQGQIWVSDAI